MDLSTRIRRDNKKKNDVLNVVQVLSRDIVKWRHGSILCVNKFQPMTAA